MKRVLIAVVSCAAAACVASASAQAHTTITCEPSCSLPYQQWADESKMPTPDVTLLVAESGCPPRGACTNPTEQLIWFTPGLRQPRRVFWHELGHNVDAYMLQPWMRERFMNLLGLTGEWVAGDPNLYSPAEEFADTYAQCALKPYLTRKEMRVLGSGPLFGEAPIGGRVVHNKICRMILNVTSGLPGQ